MYCRTLQTAAPRCASETDTSARVRCYLVEVAHG